MNAYETVCGGKKSVLLGDENHCKLHVKTFLGLVLCSIKEEFY